MGLGKYLGDSASTLYNTEGNQIQSFIPRSRFNFAVILTLVGTDGADKSLFLNKNSSESMPSYSTRTQTQKKYNKPQINTINLQ